MIPPHYPSDKIIVPYDKIRKYLLMPGREHYDEFYRVGYRPSDDVKLFEDIEALFDKSKAVEPRVYLTGESGYTVYMHLGITEKRLFLTSWKITSESELPQLVTAYNVTEERGV